jgi:hypothetical protein
VSQQPVKDGGTARVRIRGLDKLDARELEAQLGEEVAFEEEELTSDKAGEPATLIAIVWLTAMGIKALAQYLMKQLSRGELEIRLEMEAPDGTRTVKTIKFRGSSSAPPTAEETEAIATALNVDPKAVAAAFAG